jgi:uncharacterized protein
MARRTLHHTLFVLSFLLALSACNSNAGSAKADPQYTRILLAERKDKDRELLTGAILEDQYLKGFKGLQYYEPDTAYRIKARLRLLPPLPYVFKTNTERSPAYITFGLLEFKLGDSACTLIAYATDPSASEGLFIPFRDATAGTETYGGGRYLELPYKGERDYITLDFNKAFNPYCHYNHSYSCPLVPAENRLKTAIRAGEKKLHN